MITTETGSARRIVWNRLAGQSVKPSVDDDERQGVCDEGLDPDDPAVQIAIDFVRWELAMLLQS